jgi:hypothetical protein
MGSDSVAVGERSVVFGNHAAIGQHNFTAVKRFDLDQLAIDEAMTRLRRVRLQEQLVAIGNSQVRDSPVSKAALPRPNLSWAVEPSRRRTPSEPVPTVTTPPTHRATA